MASLDEFTGTSFLRILELLLDLRDVGPSDEGVGSTTSDNDGLDFVIRQQLVDCLLQLRHHL